jgi:hypothetical protein
VEIPSYERRVLTSSCSHRYPLSRCRTPSGCKSLRAPLPIYPFEPNTQSTAQPALVPVHVSWCITSAKACEHCLYRHPAQLIIPSPSQTFILGPPPNLVDLWCAHLRDCSLLLGAFLSPLQAHESVPTPHHAGAKKRAIYMPHVEWNRFDTLETGSDVLAVHQREVSIMLELCGSPCSSTKRA